MKQLAGGLAALIAAGLAGVIAAGCAEDEPKDIYVESTGTWLKEGLNNRPFQKRTEIDAAVQKFCDRNAKCLAFGDAEVNSNCVEMYTFEIEQFPDCFSAIKAQFNCLESIACEDLDALSCEEEMQSVMFCTLGMSGF